MDEGRTFRPELLLQTAASGDAATLMRDLRVRSSGRRGGGIKTSPQLSLTEVERAYAAGIIDGEGCITSTSDLNLVVSVVMVHPEIPRWLQQKFHGRIYEVKSKHGTMWAFRLHGFDCRFLLESIIPYSIEKKRSAEVGLVVIQAMEDFRNTGRRGFTKEERDIRIRLCEIIRSLVGSQSKRKLKIRDRREQISA